MIRRIAVIIIFGGTTERHQQSGQQLLGCVPENRRRCLELAMLSLCFISGNKSDNYYAYYDERACSHASYQ
jgi:hypothetical protein